ncbi:MAG: GNAT family N-acetyltransferase [Deltaproteobacteria bacterium]|nr:GNAT family N-acetyltransferase [Deltaproteobacteria bacterium]MBW1960087.1 GNAT family N-acetyltransferase [Deltaproteobacteria bacterium]MBW2153406.1 GNAT family N-acetyltransferase [Deltaproteobacteria bacterium]
MLTYTVLIKPTPDQINQITTLYRSEGWWSKPKDDPQQVKGIISGSHLFIVAKKGDEIVGMGRAISDRSSDAYIQDVTVKREYRNQGIGTTIINELVTRLRKDGVEWIGLIAERGSHGFYSRLGFKQMPNSIPMLKTF